MYLASILLERFRSSRQKAITFFAAHLAESSLREELACGPVIELLHRSCLFVCFVYLFILGRKLNRQNCLLKEVLREREEKEEKENKKRN